jgi:enolase
MELAQQGRDPFARGERTAKRNAALRIEEQLSAQVRLAGNDVFGRTKRGAAG